jgi:excinuclease ABC subunit A
MRVVADSDWVIDIGPGAGEAGGKVVATGTPATVARATSSQTAPFLRQASVTTASTASWPSRPERP